MTPPRQQKSKIYTNAPIVEALIDFRCIPNENFEPKFYTILEEALKEDFPIIGQIEECSINVNLKEKSSSQKFNLPGIRLESKEGTYVIQAKERGFTFSVLNAYTGWETFREKAFIYWSKYVEIFKPEKIVREAVRYINRIDIPTSKQNSPLKIEDYFCIYPHVFDENSAELTGLLMQVQIPQNTEGGLAVITQTTTHPSKPLHVSFILDIDVFDIQQFDNNDQDLWLRMDTFRDQKNKLFNDSISNKTKELIR